MAILVEDCPHCGAHKAAFVVVHEAVNPINRAERNCFASCPACFGALAINVHTTTSVSPKDFAGDLGSPAASSFVILGTFPKRMISACPEHVPPVAAKAFIHGSENLKDGRYSSAVAMFRRAVDVGTKVFNSEIDAFKLEKRIDKLEAAGLISKDLQAWAHKIRLEGNEAIHELDEPTKEQTQELELFTEMVLTYLFTLPEKIRANMPQAE